MSKDRAFAMPVIRWLLGSTCLLLVACGSVDETRVPAELTPVNPALVIEDRWSQSAGAGVGERYLKLHPALVGDTLYVVDAAGTLTAVRAVDGNVLWQASLDAAVIAGAQIGEGALFLGTEDGRVIAVGRNHGRERWQAQLESEVLAVSDAYLGVVVARTADSELYGLDARNGELLWQTGRTTPVLSLRGASEPVVGSGRVVVGFDDGKLVAVSPVRGNVLWTTTVADPKGRSELERMVDIDGELAVVEGIIYVTGFRGRIAAVTLSEGQALWSRELSSHVGLEVDARRVYVTDANSVVWALDRTTGATLWKQDKLEHRDLTAPVAVEQSVMVGDFEGYVHWLSKNDGRLLARSRPVSAGILSTPIATRETAYVLDRGGQIAALRLPASAWKTPAPEDNRSTEDDGLQSLELEPFPREGGRSRQ